MNNKLTWLIPGLLVTLLLGLLWAMPAFAQTAGTIQFLDKKGGDATTHVSLNGPAADGGFFVQITDADLNKATTETIEVGAASTVVDAVDWSGLADANKDGKINYRDFTAFADTRGDAEGSDPDDKRQSSETVVPIPAGHLTLNTQSGTLAISSDTICVQGSGVNDNTTCSEAVSGEDTADIDATHLEYMIFKTAPMGNRNGTDQMETLTLPSDDVGDDGADETIIGGDGSSPDYNDINSVFGGDDQPGITLVSGATAGLSLVEFASSKIADITSRDVAVAANETKLESDIAELFTAYNMGEKNRPLDVTVAVTATAKDHDTNPDTPDRTTTDSFTVTISGTDSDPDTPEIQPSKDTVCVGLVQKDTPDRPDTGDGSTGAIPPTNYDCNVDENTTGVVVYEEVSVIVDLSYQGSLNAIYSGSGRIRDDEREVGRVTIGSDAADQISVLLEETGADSGMFGTMVKICDPSADAVGTATECDDGDVATQMGETADAMGIGTVMLPVNAAGDTIRISYRDASPGGTRTRTISLDATAPSFNNPSPDSGSAGSATEPELSVEVVDTASGIVDDEDMDYTIQFVGRLIDVATGNPIAQTDSANNTRTINRSDLNDDDDITDGFAVAAAFQEGDGDDELDNDGINEYEIHWWVVATDKAGNQGVTDQKASRSFTGTVSVDKASDIVEGDGTKFSTELKGVGTIIIEGQARIIDTITDDDTLTVKRAFSADADEASFTGGACLSEAFDLHDDGSGRDSTGTEMAGCDPFVVRVDTKRPVLSKAIAGGYLDDNNMAKEGRRTSIRVEFDEALDCDSVSASDFEVDGVAPSAASCHGKYVVLTVDEMDSNATPKVELVGTVMDTASNSQDSGTIASAEDGISSNLNVSVVGTGEGDRPVTRNRVTVTITSDELLSGNPTVTIHKVGDDYKLGNSVRSGPASPTGATNTWAYSTSFTNTTDDGLYNVRVTGMDRGASSATASAGLMGVRVDADDATQGYMLNKDLVKDSKAILFEVDNEVQDPSWMPSDGSTDNPDVFIRASFPNEGKEYGLGATGDDDETAEATDDPADVATDFDTHGTVMLVSATFNGDDVTDAVTTQDNVTFFYNPRNLSIDEHQMKIKVKDNAGNEKEFTYDLAVTARQAFKLNLQPGANLVSLPSTPDDGDVNAVFGGENAITSVVTRDNGTGLWMTALRGADGMFAGDLTTIDAQHGYWVVSDAPVELSIALPRSGGLTFVPPAIEVRQGWNLVAVTDLQQRKAGTTIVATDYFANIDWDVAYGYNPLDGVFERKIDDADAADGTNNVEVGKGYWVYANKAGIIIP